jgi:hypothetical protein
MFAEPQFVIVCEKNKHFTTMTSQPKKEVSVFVAFSINSIKSGKSAREFTTFFFFERKSTKDLAFDADFASLKFKFYIPKLSKNKIPPARIIQRIHKSCKKGGKKKKTWER